MVSSDLRVGVRDSLPLMPGIVPFALVAGVAAVSVGFSVEQAVGLSVVVFAGASQLAAIDLVGANAPLAVVVFTAAIINLRMVMYSASLAPHFQSFRTRWKALLAYLLTDQAYALSIAEYGENEARSRKWYYLGVAAPLWIVWQLGTLAGALAGAGIPDRWGLEFAVPLVFLALLVPAMKDRPTSAAGVAGAVIAVVAAGLPFNLGLPVAAVIAVAVGLLVEQRGGA